MPANAAIIGRVAVKVLPDTGDFRKEAQRKLDAIERQVEFAVPTKVDITGAQKDLLENVRKINAENKEKDSRKIRLYTTFSTANIRQELNKVIRRYNEQSDAGNNKVKINTDLVAGELQLDVSDENLRHVKKKIDDWRKDNSPVKLEVKLDYSSVSGQITEKRIAIAARPRTVELFPKINQPALTSVVTTLAALSGARVLNEMFGDFSRWLKNLDKSIPLIGSIALAVMSLAAAGLSAASNLAALSSSLALIGPAALSMPGLFGGFAVGIATMVLALKDFSKVFPDVSGKLSALQDLVSGNFWAKAQAPMREMIDRLLPQFTAGFGQAATELGGFFGTLAGEISHSFDGEIKQMFTDLSKSITIASGSTDAIANSFKVLGSVGASYLPVLAQWFVKLADQFSNWLTRVSKSGELKLWIDNGVMLLGQLGSAIASISRTFSGIGKAAMNSGGSGLVGFAAGLKSIASTVNSPAFQQGLIGTFVGAHRAMGQIATIAGGPLKNALVQIGKTFETLLPLVGGTMGAVIKAISNVVASPALMGGIQKMFNGLDQGVSALAPAFEALAPVIGDVMSLIGVGLKQLGPLLAAALGAISPILEAILPALEPLVKVLSGALTSAIVALTPMFKMMGTAISGFIKPLAGALQPALQQLMPVLSQIGDLFGQVALTLLPALGEALAQLLPALVPLIAAFLQLILAVLKPLLPALAELIANWLPKLVTAIAGAVTAIVPFVNAMASVVSFIMPILVPALKFLADILLSTVVMAINGVKDVFNGVLNIVMGIWNTFAGLFTGNWTQFWNGIKQFFKGTWDLIVGIVELVFSLTMLKALKAGFVAIKALFTGEGAALTGLWRAAWNAIKAAAEAVWSAIRTGLSLFLQALLHEPAQAMAILRATFSDAWGIIRGVFSEAWRLIKLTVTTNINGVIDLVKGIPGKAKDALGNLGSVLIDAGKALIRGFIDGIGSMFDAVKGKLGDLTNKLTSWKGPEPLDRVLLYDAGRLVIGGFINGLESQYDAVRKSLAGLTDEVGDTDFTSPNVGITARMNGLIGSALDDGGSGTGKTLNYYAAPGSSLGSEEDLFAAAGRSRFAW